MPSSDRVTPDADGLVRRHFTVPAGVVSRADAGSGAAREFTGIGVPWDEVIDLGWLGSECFDRDSVDATGSILLYRHDEPVGVILETRSSENGLELDARISDTALGRDAWTLIQDGAIRSLSIGFEPLEYRVDEDDVLHWTKVRGREFSLVPFPAYAGAAIDPATLRHSTTTTERPTMPQPTDAVTRADLTPINEALDDLTRSVTALGVDRTPTGPDGHQWRSMGQFLKALAAGDDNAAEFHRAYTGATTADTVMKDSFVGDYIQLVQDHRRIVADFSTGTLPEKGTSVDYVKLDEDTTKVEEQANEGDDLAYGQVKLIDANAKVKTAGGWTEMSRQLIERATTPTLDITLRALGLKYARYTNALVTKALKDTIAANIAADASDDLAAIDLAAAATADDWIDAIIDAAITFEERGFNLEQLHVSGDVFKRLARLKDGGKRVMSVYGASLAERVGEISLPQVSGELARIPVKLLPGRTVTNAAAFSDRVAVEFLESAGAPAQLQDENIINLTKQFSIYGYSAVLVPFPSAILPVQFGA